MKTNCLPQPHRPVVAMPESFRQQAMGEARRSIPSPALAAQAAADCRRADRLDAVLDSIKAMAQMDADEMLEVLRALERAADGQTCGALQECRETVEGDMPQPEVEAYPLDFSGERRHG